MSEKTDDTRTTSTGINFRLATREDNDGLVALTSSSEMPGEMGLRIERHPDFFRLLELRGETKVFIVLDGDKLIGSLCATRKEVYVGGKIYPLQYIGDFKMEKSYRKQGLGLKLCDQMAAYVISQGADLAFLDVSKGNMKPLSFFRDRPNVPDFDPIGIFHNYQFIGKRFRTTQLPYEIAEASPSGELVAFFNKHSSQYQLGAVITEKQLEGNEIYVVRDKGRIQAAMCLADTMHAKQNVVTRISFRLNILLKMLNAARWFTGYSKMPSLQEPVRMLYVKYFFIDTPDKALAGTMLQYGRGRVHEKGYSLLSLSLHEKDPLNACFSGLFKLTFNSVGMLLSIKNNRDLIQTVQQGIPFEDFSLV